MSCSTIFSTTSHHILSHHILSHHLTSLIAPHHNIFYHITPHHFISHNTSHHFSSILLVSDHITSYHITPRHITSHHITSHDTLSHHATSHYASLLITPPLLTSLLLSWPHLWITDHAIRISCLHSIPNSQIRDELGPTRFQNHGLSSSKAIFLRGTGRGRCRITIAKWIVSSARILYACEGFQRFCNDWRCAILICVDCHFYGWS